MRPGFAYLAILLVSVAAPLAFSLAGPWRADAREWKRVLLSLLLAGPAFVVWDIFFASRGIWGFNPRYLLGPAAFGLPAEEIGFFVAIPFACLFIHRAVSARPGLAAPRAWLRPLWFSLAAAAFAAALSAAGKPYSQAAFGLAALLLVFHGIRLPEWSGRFLITLAWHYLPFLLVNGLLTALPVVTYSPEAILGPRIGSIPVEDAAFSFSLLFLHVAAYESLRAIPRPARSRRPEAAAPVRGVA